MSLRVTFGLQGNARFSFVREVVRTKLAVHKNVVRWQLLGAWRPAVQEVVDLVSEDPEATPDTAHATDQAPNPKSRPKRPRRRGVWWADESSGASSQHNGSGAAAAHAHDVIGGGGGGGGDHGASSSGEGGAAVDTAGDAALAAQLAFGSDDDDDPVVAAADDDVSHTPRLSPPQAFQGSGSRAGWGKHGGVSQIAAQMFRQAQYNCNNNFQTPMGPCLRLVAC